MAEAPPIGFFLGTKPASSSTFYAIDVQQYHEGIQFDSDTTIVRHSM